MFKCVSQERIYCEVKEASASGPLTSIGPFHGPASDKN